MSVPNPKPDFDVRGKLLAYLREVVPCPSDDPFTQESYERALLEWTSKPPFERDAYGFAFTISNLFATDGIERGWPA